MLVVLQCMWNHWLNGFLKKYLISFQWVLKKKIKTTKKRKMVRWLCWQIIAVQACRYDWFPKSVGGSFCIISSTSVAMWESEAGLLLEANVTNMVVCEVANSKRPCLKQGRCQEWSVFCSSPDSPLTVPQPYSHVYTRVYTHMHRIRKVSVWAFFL